jgi:hypothetical protein
MICQLCLSAEATSHVTELVLSGQFLHVHYCQACCAAKYLKQSTRQSDFPRPTFTLQALMALVASFAVPNILVAWAAGSGLIPKTAQELQQWTLSAFLTVNVCFGLVMAYVALSGWLRRLIWFRRTAGLVPMPQRWSMYPAQGLTWLADSLVFIYGSLTAFFFARILPHDVLNIILLPVVAAIVSFALAKIAVKHPAIRPVWESIRHEWWCASGPERVLMVVAPVFSWPTYIVLVATPTAFLLFRRVNAWYVIPLLISNLLGCRALFAACVMIATRRRY